MSRIIGQDRATAGATVQGFTGQQPALAPAAWSDAMAAGNEPANVAPADAVTTDRIALLEREIAALSAQLDAQATRQEQLQQQAFEKGRAEGSQQTREDTDRRNEAVQAGIVQAAARFAEASRQAEVLALQLASAAVARVLGEATDVDARLRQVIATCLDRYAAQHPQALRLSRKDFPQQADVEQLAAQWPGLRIGTDPALAAGECVLQLELGEVDIGLPGQIARLRNFFDDAVREALHAAAEGVRA